MMEVVRNQDIRPLRCVDTGDGPALVLLHGFAMQPETYLPLARLLSDRIRVVIPAIFALPGRWTFERALSCIGATLDDRGLERVSLLGHSFGGGLELGLAARQAFARDLHASFNVVRRPPGYGRIDHDWMFDDPELFAAHLEALGLQILSTTTTATVRRSEQP